MSGDEEQIRAIVRDELTRMFSQLIPQQPKDEWLPTRQAAKRLGIGHSTLLEWKESPEFKHGVHYESRTPPGAKQERYWFNIQKCQEVMKKPPKKRRA